MKLYIKRTPEPSNLGFIIFNEKGHVKYNIYITYTSLTMKLDVYTATGKRIAKIRKRDILAFKTYTISCANNKIKVIAMLSDLGTNFYINGISWHFQGNVMEKNFEVIDVDKSIVMAQVAKSCLNLSQYELNIKKENKELLCVCIALCIDVLLINSEKEVTVCTTKLKSV